MFWFVSNPSNVLPASVPHPDHAHEQACKPVCGVKIAGICACYSLRLLHCSCLKGLASSEGKRMNLVSGIHSGKGVAKISRALVLVAETEAAYLGSGVMPASALLLQDVCGFTLGAGVCGLTLWYPQKDGHWPPSPPLCWAHAECPCGDARQNLSNIHLNVAIPFLPVSHVYLQADEKPFCLHFADGKGGTLRGCVICLGWCSKSMGEKKKRIRPLHAI